MKRFPWITALQVARWAGFPGCSWSCRSRPSSVVSFFDYTPPQIHPRLPLIRTRELLLSRHLADHTCRPIELRRLTGC